MLNDQQFYLFGQIQAGGQSYMDTSPYKVSECKVGVPLLLGSEYPINL